MKDTFHLQLRSKRENSQFSDSRLAAILNITIAAYGDLERRADEWRRALPVNKLRVLAALLDIDLRTEIGLEPSTEEHNNVENTSTLIRSLREKRGMSLEEFSDAAGFYPEFGCIVESHPFGLELYPLAICVDVAEALDVPWQGFVSAMLARMG
ncbi:MULTISPECIES: hypothetical protein [unclassified Bradyrhizobium]|uniref:hypothetical protein n=1 Tax=unclassified Bradyrhizobium TaxID=2631580 RepID=UPI0028EDFF29|nr:MULTISPECIES: hypothetical protein [unclassified Bradyrhizobium]